ncbi:hypothetical protein VUR80DRAFT_4835 [Thermomyces stellatus]
MKTHLLLVLASVTLAVAMDNPQIYGQASPDRKPSPNVMNRGFAYDFRYGDRDEDGKFQVDEEAEDPPEPAHSQTQNPSRDDPPEDEDGDTATAIPASMTADTDDKDPSVPGHTPKEDPSYGYFPGTEDEDTTTTPSTSETADAEATNLPGPKQTGTQDFSYENSPETGDGDAPSIPPTSTTADTEGNVPPGSEPTQKDPPFGAAPETGDRYTTTVTSTSTVTHFVTVHLPSSSSDPSSSDLPRESDESHASERSPTFSGAIGAADPIEGAESHPGVGNDSHGHFDPAGTGNANSSIPHPTAIDGPRCSCPCEEDSIPELEGSLSQTTGLQDGSDGTGQATTAASTATSAGPGNTTEASAAAGSTTANPSEELADDDPSHHTTQSPTDTANAAAPPATEKYPEKSTATSPPWSPTTGAVASQTAQAEGVSGTRRWVPDLSLAGVVFLLVGLLGKV